MTDNGPAYVSAAHALACRALGISHIRTRPYRPQTNGKAERFIRTMLREWAYAAVYGSSPERAAALSGWLERYNSTRRHGALGHRPPIARHSPQPALSAAATACQGRRREGRVPLSVPFPPTPHTPTPAPCGAGVDGAGGGPAG